MRPVYPSTLATPRIRRLSQLWVIPLAAFLAVPWRGYSGGVVTSCDEASLRAALAGGGLVTFACNGTILLTATLVIANDTIIDGTNRSVTISGNDVVRVMQIGSNITATILNLTIANGRWTNGTRSDPLSSLIGAGILNLNGKLNLTNCQFTHNAAIGSNGPPVNYGAQFYDGLPGYAAGGGAICNSGELNIGRCFFFANRAAAGDGSDAFSTPTIGNGSRGGDGATAEGGAIYNAGTLRITETTFSSNIVSGGNGGGGAIGAAVQPYGAPGGDGGAGGVGLGGGIYNAGVVSIERSTFLANSVTGGTGGHAGDGTADWGGGSIGGTGGVGGTAMGGSLFNTGAWGVTNCTLSGNAVSGSKGGTGGNGGSALYGALPGSCGGNGGIGGNGGDGKGGSLFGAAGAIVCCTFSSNAITAGIGGTAGVPGVARYGCTGLPGTNGWGGIAGATCADPGPTGSLQAINTIFASGSGGSNCSGTITDLGYNLSSDSSPQWSSGTSRNNTNPKLGSLADNGGPTMTMALSPDSPALDAGIALPGINTDQRGYLRQYGSAPDIGAYELNATLPATTFRLSQPVISNGVVWVQVTGPPGKETRFQRSPNMKDWTDAATNTTDGRGIAAFGDTTPPLYRMFYRTVLP